MLRIAIPNKGALSEGAIELIQKAGYGLRKGVKDLHCVDAGNGVEFYFLRPTDIPTYVESGVFQFGITGRDIMLDSGVLLHEALPLNFGRSKMHYIIPQGQEFTGLQQFQGKRIACSYPNLVRRHLAAAGVQATVIELSGAVEISIQLGIADAAADVVETGTTIRQAGLKTVGEALVHSEAIVVCKDASGLAGTEAQRFLRRLQGIVTARQYAMVEYDVRASDLDKCCAICPGLQSPTVMPLQNAEWRAVKVMVLNKELVDVVDRLADAGAKGIIVTEIRNCRL